MYQKLEQSVFLRETLQTHLISFILIVDFKNLTVELNVLIISFMFEMLKF